MKRFFYIISLFAVFCFFNKQNSYAFDLFPESPAENQEIWSSDWDSEEGIELLNSSSYKSDFYQLINFYQPQINPLYCSAAAGVIILNALNYGEIPSQKDQQVEKPETMGGGIIEYNIYSQESFFNPKTDFIKNRQIIDLKAPKDFKYNRPNFDPGLTLNEFALILERVYHLNIEKIHIKSFDEKSLNDFRELIKNIMNESNNFIIANFDGKILGKETRGHISPIVAYNEENDKILIMDVALHKNKWFWVSTEQLLKAMNTKDGDNFRGYLIISKKP